MIKRMLGNNLLSQCMMLFFNNNMIKRAAIVFVLVLIIFIAIWVRAFIGSMKNFLEGEEYFHNRQYINAITFFDRSMHWYTPFNPYINRSAEYLWKISNKAEENNDYQLSLIAIETIRNSFYSSRGFYSPGTNWIERCDDKILDIIKKQNDKIIKGKGEFGGQEKLYKQDIIYNDPAILWTMVLEIGLFGWIGTVLGSIFFYLRPCLKTDRYVHNYWFWILLACINYCLWILGIIKA